MLVYGIVDGTARAPRSAGIDGVRPRIVRHREVGAIVGDVEGPVQPKRRNLHAHLAVLSTAHRRGTVLPLQFGVVVADEEELREQLLSPLHDRLRTLLDRFENLVEVQLQARYEEQVVLGEIVRESEHVRRLRAAVGSRPEGSALRERLQLGELVARAHEEKRQLDAGQLLRRLVPLSDADLVADEVPESGVLKASFLVRQSQLPAFDSHVEDWAREQAGRVVCQYVGPMPPYSFARLEEAWE